MVATARSSGDFHQPPEWAGKHSCCVGKGRGGSVGGLEQAWGGEMQGKMQLWKSSEVCHHCLNCTGCGAVAGSGDAGGQCKSSYAITLKYTAPDDDRLGDVHSTGGIGSSTKSATRDVKLQEYTYECTGSGSLLVGNSLDRSSIVDRCQGQLSR